MNEQYGWRLVDFNQIVRDKLEEIMALPVKPPNNLTNVGPCMVCLSNEELQEIKDGKPFPAWKFLPWVMEYLNVPLSIKIPKEEDPAAVNTGDMSPNTLNNYNKTLKKAQQEKEKKEKEEKAAAEAKAARAAKRAELLEADPNCDLEAAGYPESEEEIKIDDLSIESLVVECDEQGNLPKIGQIVMYGFPQTELHITKMKEFGLVFDKIIYMTDQNEEEPGKEIIKRMQNVGDFVYDFEEEKGKAQKVIDTIKEHIGEDNIVEVDCNGGQADVFIKLQTKIDPFFAQADSEDIKFDWSSMPEVAEDVPRRGPKSDFGDYCPVTYCKSGFLIKGKEDFQVFMYGKSYRCAGEDEMNEFKFNPDAFLSKVTIPLPAPEPKIMIIGQKGSGVSTQIDKLCKKFKINSLCMRDKFMELFQEEKGKRRRMRMLTRGFKEPEVNDDADPNDPPVVDEELENDTPEFKEVIETHYQDLFKRIMPSEKPLVMDGNWTTVADNWPEDYDPVTFQDTLTTARRTPEVVVVLKCKEKTTFDRCIFPDQIQKQFDLDYKNRKETIQKATDEARKEKLEEVTKDNAQDPETPEEERKPQEEIDAAIKEAMDEWDEARKAEDEEALADEEACIPVERRLEEIQEKMREQRDKEIEYIDALTEKFKEEGVEILQELNTDISADFVHIKILDMLKPRMSLR
jgi:hypothetical protein